MPPAQVLQHVQHVMLGILCRVLLVSPVGLVVLPARLEPMFVLVALKVTDMIVLLIAVLNVLTLIVRLVLLQSELVQDVKMDILLIARIAMHVLLVHLIVRPAQVLQYVQHVMLDFICPHQAVLRAQYQIALHAQMLQFAPPVVPDIT